MAVYPGTATTGHDPDAKTLLEQRQVAARPARPRSRTSTPRSHNVFMHHNTGPFIAKQLIQRLVTGNPSPAYVQRVATVFNNNGAGVRGDLKAVVRAILMDAEARGPAKTDPTFGTLREPVLMITGMIRALNGVTDGTRARRPRVEPGPAPVLLADGVQLLPAGLHAAAATRSWRRNSRSTTATRRWRATNLVYNLVYAGIAPDGNLPNAIGTRLNIAAVRAVRDRCGDRDRQGLGRC